MTFARQLARYGRVDPGTGYGQTYDYDTDDTVAVAADGAVLTNRGASSTISLTLPPAVAGRGFTVQAVEPYRINLVPDSGDTIRGSTTAYPMVSSDLLVLSCTEAGDWIVAFASGDDRVASVTRYGALFDGVTDDTAAFLRAIAAGGADFTLDMPEGDSVVNNIIFTGTGGFRLRGQGPLATRLIHTPAADGDKCLTLSRSTTGTTGQCQLLDFAIVTSDTSYDKVGLSLVDCGETTVRNVRISGYNDNNDSVGLETFGRESLWVHDFECVAAVPVRLRPNPDLDDEPASGDSGWLSADHFNFHNCYLSQSGTPATLTKAVVLIDDGCHISQLQFTGTQAWVGGGYGLYWNQASENSTYMTGLKLENVRTEGTAGSEYSVYVNVASGASFTAATNPLYNLQMVNCEFDSGRNGVYTGNVWHVDFDNVTLNQANPRVIMNINKARSVTWKQVNTLSTASASGVTLDSNMYLSEAGPHAEGCPWPINATWSRRDTAATYDEMPNREMLAHKWYWGGQLTANATVQLPNHNGNNWELSNLRVIAENEVNTTTGTYARGEFDFVPFDTGAGNDNGVIRVSGTANCVSTDTGAASGDLCVYCSGANPMDAPIYIQNRTSVTLWVVAELLGKRSVET